MKNIIVNIILHKYEKFKRQFKIHCDGHLAEERKNEL